MREQAKPSHPGIPLDPFYPPPPLPASSLPPSLPSTYPPPLPSISSTCTANPAPRSPPPRRGRCVHSGEVIGGRPRAPSALQRARLCVRSLAQATYSAGALWVLTYACARRRAGQSSPPPPSLRASCALIRCSAHGGSGPRAGAAVHPPDPGRRRRAPGPARGGLLSPRRSQAGARCARAHTTRRGRAGVRCQAGPCTLLLASCSQPRAAAQRDLC
jgi:hypothetical protein